MRAARFAVGPRRPPPPSASPVCIPTRTRTRCRPATAQPSSHRTRSDAARAASAAPVKTTRSSRPRPSTRGACRRVPRRPGPRERRGEPGRALIACGWACQRPVEPSMSVMQSVTTPVGRSASQPARRRSTSSPAEEGRREGSVAVPSLIASSNTRRRSASRPDGHSGAPPRGGLPVRSVNAVMAREKMSEARVGGSPAATSGATNPGSPRPGNPVAGRGEPEVHDDDSAVLREDEVGGLDVAVDYRRILPVQDRRAPRLPAPGSGGRSRVRARACPVPRAHDPDRFRRSSPTP